MQMRPNGCYQLTCANDSVTLASHWLLSEQGADSSPTGGVAHSTTADTWKRTRMDSRSKLAMQQPHRLELSARRCESNRVGLRNIAAADALRMFAMQKIVEKACVTSYAQQNQGMEFAWIDARSFDQIAMCPAHAWD